MPAELELPAPSLRSFLKIMTIQDHWFDILLSTVDRTQEPKQEEQEHG